MDVACWVLTHGMGVYYLHAAAIALVGALLPAICSVLGGCFISAPGRIPGVEVGLFTLIGGMGLLWRLHVGIDRIRAPALSLLQDGVSPGGVWLGISWRRSGCYFTGKHAGLPGGPGSDRHKHRMDAMLLLP